MARRVLGIVIMVLTRSGGVLVVVAGWVLASCGGRATESSRQRIGPIDDDGGQPRTVEPIVPPIAPPGTGGAPQMVPPSPPIWAVGGAPPFMEAGPPPPVGVEAGGVCPFGEAMAGFSVTIPALPGGTAVVGAFNSGGIEFDKQTTDAPGQIGWTACPRTTVIVSRFDAERRPIATIVSSLACVVEYSGPSRVLHVPGDFSAIQLAIDAASGGDTVLVAPGVYTENLQLRSGITLRGEDARTTILDGQGRGENLVDFTGARDVVITGFTFRGVGQREGCANPSDVLACSGNWYSAGVYADGHSAVGDSTCAETTGLIAGNVFAGNDIGVLLYYLPQVVIANNLFVENRNALVANHFGDSRGLVLHNVFYGNTTAISWASAYLHVVNNVFSGSHRGVQDSWDTPGRSMCNVFDELSIPTSNSSANDSGNVLGNPLFTNPEAGDFSLAPGSVGVDAGCFSPELQDLDGSPPDTGAFGGPWAMPKAPSGK